MPKGPIREPEEHVAQPVAARKISRKAFFWLVLAALVAVGIFMARDSRGEEYHAVFLNNGQVYFGKLSRMYSRYPELREVYYLQVAQQSGAAQLPTSNINLVKLGDELHGPTDKMRINRQSILFIEELKADSKVTQAIKQLQGK